MFNPGQATSAVPPQDSPPDAPTTTKDVAVIILRVLSTSQKQTTEAVDTLSDAFAADAAIKPTLTPCTNSTWP